MKKKAKDMELLLARRKPKCCPRCRGKIDYIGIGTYRCSVCKYEFFDDFGKIKDFLDQNGPAPATVINSATGVDTEIINYYLREGRLEIPDGDGLYIKCEGCGCDIRYGRYCVECAKKMSGDLKSAFMGTAGERPTIKSSSEDSMHFLGRNRNNRLR